MNNWDKIYYELLKKILNEGERTKNRTINETIKIPFYTFELDTKEQFPILTVKQVGYKWAILEMLWIYQVQSNDVRWLNDRGITIWDEWKIDPDGVYRIRDKEGNIVSEKNFGIEWAHTIGTAYGYIAKKFGLTQQLIETLKNNPTDRRMNLSLWQNDYLDTAVLPSCVFDSMWDVTDGKLNTMVVQRSCDVALGLPFNVTQYAAFQHMIAQVCNLEVGKLYWTTKDAHIYVNQLGGVIEHIRRYEDLGPFESPQFELNKDVTDFFMFDNSKELKDVKVLNYKHHGKIRMDVSI